MATWTNPPSMTAGTLVTETYWNTNVQQNLLYLANPPYCAVIAQATATTMTTANTWYAIAMDVEVSDPFNMHDTVTNNSRITIPANMGGIYLVTAGAMISTTTATTSLKAAIFVNGAIEQTAYTSAWASTNGFLTSSVNKIMNLSAGQYVELQTQCNVAAIATQTANAARSYLTVRFLGFS